MAIAPYQKLSGDDVRSLSRQLRENGEIQENYEQNDEPQYVTFASEKDYLDHLTKQSQLATEIYHMRSESTSVKTETAESENNNFVESDIKVESSEFKIGNATELTFSAQTIEVTTTQESKTETPAKTIAEQTPSDMEEIMSYVDFGKWTKKGTGAIFGVFKGLFGGLFSVAKDASKVEKPKTEAQLKADKKAKEAGIAKSAFYARLEKVQAEAQASAQAIVAKTMARLGLGGMSADMLNSYLGENRNSSSEEVNVYTAFEVARKAEEAKKAQEKQVKDMQMAASRPAINMDAAVEGGTGGGQANMSAVSAGG